MHNFKVQIIFLILIFFYRNACSDINLFLAPSSRITESQNNNTLTDYGNIMEKILLYHQKRDALPEKIDSVIVCGSSDMKVPSEALKIYMEKYKNVPVIVTGFGGIQIKANPPPYYVSEARRFKKILTDGGIPEENIYIEEESVNTAENMMNSRKLMESSGIPCKTVLLFQMPLGQRIAGENFKKTFGYEAINYSPYIIPYKKDDFKLNADIFRWALRYENEENKISPNILYDMRIHLKQLIIKESKFPYFTLKNAEAELKLKLIEKNKMHFFERITHLLVNKAEDLLKKGCDFNIITPPNSSVPGDLILEILPAVLSEPEKVQKTQNTDTLTSA